jgi:hypothetical protein
MKLWAHWYRAVLMLRPTCARMRTFLWFVACLVGMTVRGDFLGVTSIVRALGLKGMCYDRILDFYHGSGLKLGALTRRWVRTTTAIYPHVLRVHGRLLLVGDGIKIAKEGKKMPAVKGLHQQSIHVKLKIPFYHGAFLSSHWHPCGCLKQCVCRTPCQPNP